LSGLGKSRARFRQRTGRTASMAQAFQFTRKAVKRAHKIRGHSFLGQIIQSSDRPGIISPLHLEKRRSQKSSLTSTTN
jgi:hypothetical protein